MRKIGINLIRNMEISADDYIKTIAELGFKKTFSGVLEDEKEQLRIADFAAKHSIEFETLHAPFKRINNIWFEGEIGEDVLSELKMGLRRCKKVGAKIFVVHLSSGDNAPTLNDIGMKRFEELVEHADKNGVMIAFENQRKMGNLAWAIERFPSSGFCYDTGHENCFTPGKRFMPLFWDRLVCTHIHDNFGIYNNDLHLLPFDGNANFERVAEDIRASGYKGSLMLEVNPLQADKYNLPNPYEGVSAEDYLIRAAERIKRLRDMVDGK